MKYLNLSALFFCLGIILIYSCKPEDKMGQPKVLDTRQLVQEANSKIGPMNITYTLNIERAKIYEQQAMNQTGVDKLNTMIKYANEMLNGGETKLAMNTYDMVIKEANQIGVDLNSAIGVKLKSALAIAYMRLGEQENCIQNHNHESCIVPIANDGVHTLVEGSTKAIKILEEILQVDPQNHQSIWLLNLAHMTLGTYPQDVPQQFLLPPSYFKENNSIFPKFENVASQMGIDDNRLSGAAIYDDFDNDMDLDIICTSWGFNDQIKYFVNDGQGMFHEKAIEKGLEGVVGGLNIKQTDYNNDGFLDIYIMRGAWMRWDGAIPNTLLKNNGDGSFTDVTIEAGLTKHSPTQASSWNDFNLDGWLDLVVFNESFDTVRFPTQLWINNKNGTFTDVASESGLTDIAYFKGVSVEDINNDGFPDIYASILGGNNKMYFNKGLNENNIPVFQDFAPQLGLVEPMFAFPNFIFDFNNDGNYDIFVSSFKSKIDNPAADFAMNLQGINTGGTSALYLNLGGGKFEEVHEKIGMNEAMYTMGCNYGDIDNDGYIDFYLGTGDPSFYSIVPNKLFKNMNGTAVKDVSYASGMAHIQKGHGISMADGDRDGDLDIYAVMGGAYQGDVFQNAYFENPGNSNHFIILHLEGTQSNKKAIGARVIVTIDENGKERKLYRSLNSGASFGANSLEMEIGVGQAQKIKQIEVKWPFLNTPVQVFYNLEVDSHYKIIEGETNVQKLDLKNTVFHKMDSHHH